ncbi:universal stress protein [Candidatus Deferrimicrobium sp.]|uniref:universal stress protein n=1 Tax=Candidatus Deferrimicrobium sp. TaxID=3060586 RepID=UPI002ED7E96C
MYTNILLPTDGLGKCKFGTCHGVLLAKNLGAKVTAVCVTEKLSGQEILKIYNPHVLIGTSAGTVAQASMKNAEDLHKEFAGKALEVAEKMCAENGVKCEKVHLAGESPTDGILKVAKEKSCDLIFISTHGNPGLMGTLFGTVVSKILSRSSTPVLVHHCGGPG